MNEIDSIAKLEAILNEFYHQSTSNFRKKEIERDLKIFQDNDTSWNFVIHHLGSSGFNNQYLWFFSVSTIEVSFQKLLKKCLFLQYSCDILENFSPFPVNNHEKMEQAGWKIKNTNTRFPLAYLLQLSS